jgi:hypothetical protein
MDLADRGRRLAAALAVALALPAVLGAVTCHGAAPAPAGDPVPRAGRDGAPGAGRGAGPATARVLLGGDVVLGTGTAGLTSTDPSTALAGVGAVVGDADLTAADLASPLPMLRGTGAFPPRIVTARGVRVAMLAVDAGPRAGPHQGAAPWEGAGLRQAVLGARRSADVVIVAVHGGTGYRPDTGPWRTALAKALASWGADVVWGYHPHTVQPVTVTDPDGDGRPTVVATGPDGPLLDRPRPATILELLAGRDGVRAVRRGEVRIARGRAALIRWLGPDPGADAAMLHGGWWQVTSASPLPAVSRPDPATRRALASALSPGTLLDVTTGDVDGDGRNEAVALFRRPYRPTEVGSLLPRSLLVDAEGRSQHVGVYRLADRREVWVAGSVLAPLVSVAACDRWLAVGLARPDGEPGSAGVGAWHWGGFGFTTYPDLPGSGRPACADVDSDGSLDPLATGRSLP